MMLYFRDRRDKNGNSRIKEPHRILLYRIEACAVTGITTTPREKYRGRRMDLSENLVQ